MLYPNIEAERAKHGLTKGSLCTLLGISYGTYKAWQDGACKMNCNDLLKMTKLFGCSADHLIKGGDG